MILYNTALFHSHGKIAKIVFEIFVDSYAWVCVLHPRSQFMSLVSVCIFLKKKKYPNNQHSKAIYSQRGLSYCKKHCRQIRLVVFFSLISGHCTELWAVWRVMLRSDELCKKATIFFCEAVQSPKRSYFSLYLTSVSFSPVMHHGTCEWQIWKSTVLHDSCRHGYMQHASCQSLVLFCLLIVLLFYFHFIYVSLPTAYVFLH